MSLLKASFVGIVEKQQLCFWWLDMVSCCLLFLIHDFFQGACVVFSNEFVDSLTSLNSHCASSSTSSAANC